MSTAAGGAGRQAQANTHVYALLTDGSTVEIRAARPEDAEAVREMHAVMSPSNLYLRFFSMSPYSAVKEAERVCRPPGPDHAVLLAWLGGRLVGVASYELAETSGTAEVAFAVPDDMHGKGIATLLLEHLVSVAGDRGVRAFTAETLTENTAMLQVFADAGLPVRRQRSSGVVELTFPLPGVADPGLDQYLDQVAARESRADVASLQHLLWLASVAVVGASRRRGTVGREILHNIVTGGFAGAVYPVNPRASSLDGLRCLASVDDLPDHVDMAVIAVPAARRPVFGRHHLGPWRPGRRPAGHLPQVRHAAGRPQLFRCRRSPPWPGRDLRRQAPGSGQRGRRRSIRRHRHLAARAPVPAGHRRVVVRVGR